MTKEITVGIAGLDQDVFTESGDYGSGFWHNELLVDLEELAAGNLDKAFVVIADIHDTAGTSFREYHGIDVSAKLPNGATREAIQDFCNNIAERAEELTRGFDAEWNGSNHVAAWRDEDGEKLVPSHFDYSEDFPGAQYFPEGFREAVAELDAREIYDLAYSENVPFVHENISSDFEDAAAVLTKIEEEYDNDESGEYFFINHADAAAKIWEKIEEKRSEDEA